MYSLEVRKFKHCSINTSKVRNEKYLVVQLSRQLNSIRFSFGRETKENFNKAIKMACEVDNYCDHCLSLGQPVDSNQLKAIAKSVKQPVLELIKTPELTFVWDAYVLTFVLASH
jgi:hypothetical protein